MADQTEAIANACIENNRDSVNRIRRIQGQLESLIQLLENDEGSCEEYLIRARTVEKAVSSLMNQMIVCHMNRVLQTKGQDSSNKQGKDLAYLLKLLK